jgi:hypothetical protein
MFEEMNKYNYFIHITDLHLTNSNKICWKALETFVEQIRKMSPLPDFVICTGDIGFAHMDMSTSPYELCNVFEKYYRIMKGLPVPLYNTIGNHDMAHSQSTLGTCTYGKEPFIRYLGSRYQSFDWHHWHAIIIDEWVANQNPQLSDSAILTQDIDHEQLTWLKEDLAKQHSHSILFFTHHRLMNNPILWNKLKNALPGHLNYTEIAGCDHQNSFWTNQNWHTFTTSSFCGGWWNGNSPDGNKPGYSLMLNDSQSLCQYFRAIDEPLAVASPRIAQIVTSNNVHIDAIDPSSGKRIYKYFNISGFNFGFEEIDISIDDKTQKIKVFNEPTINKIYNDLEVYLEFTICKSNGNPLVIKSNNHLAGQLNKCQEFNRFDISAYCNLGWNKITIVGNAIIHSIRLAVGNNRFEDPRIIFFESFRPEWFNAMNMRKLSWDLSLKSPKKPSTYPGNDFYFYLEKQ